MIIQEAIQRRHSKHLVQIRTRLLELIVKSITTTIKTTIALDSSTKTTTLLQIGWMSIWVVPLHRITSATSWLVEMP